MNNLLGDFTIGTEGGTLDGHIRKKAEGDLADLYKRMHALLDEQFRITGCRAEPRW